MENNSFKTVAFGGFDKQDVIQYIERTARENAELQNTLQKKAEAFERELYAAKGEAAAAESKRKEAESRCALLQIELEKERAARKELEVLKDLAAEAEGLRAENETLRADAEAYIQFRNRIGSIECEARKRAADLEADTVAQLRQTLDLFRKKYQELMNTFETTASYVTGELRKVEVNLTQLPRAMDQSGADLNELAAVLEKYQSELK